MRTRVKICGTTRMADAQAAITCGADALGFIFYPKSPRYITPYRASRIIEQLPPFVDRVGVFVDGELATLVDGAATGLTYFQLHGNESVDYCYELRERVPGCRLIKAFRVGEQSRAEDFAPFNDCVDAFLLDTYIKDQKGGTGKIFDWSIIDRLELKRPVLLAGGLTPENIVEAISAVNPYAVDVNSGVESQPGVKDPQRLLQLMLLVARTWRNKL